MFFLVTLDEPVIFVAITSFSRRDLSFFIQLDSYARCRPRACGRRDGVLLRGVDRAPPFSSTA